MILIEEHSKNYQRYLQNYRISFVSCSELSISNTYTTGTLHNAFLLYFNSGNATITISGKQYDVSENTCVYIKKNHNFKITSTDNCNLLSLEFDMSYPITSFENKSIFIFGNANDIKHDIRRIYEAYMFRQTLPGFFEASLIVLLDKLVSYSESSSSLNLFNQYCSIIEQNAHRSISVKEVAAELGYSYEHICKVVKKCSGKTANMLISECRIAKIKALCSDNRYTTDELATMLDFGSAELLRKYFKYHTGENLTDYIASAKQTI